MKSMATVTGVYTVTDPLSKQYGQQLVNTDKGGGPDGVIAIVNALPGYFPQNGDKVLVEDIGAGVWVVAGCLTPNRGLVVDIPEVSAISVQNAAPGGGWVQLSTLWAEPGVTTNPDLIVVPTTPVTLPPPSTAGTYVQEGGIVSRAYRHDFGGSWAGDTLNPHQGLYDGPEGRFGPWDGAWFYPSMVSALSGKTITAFSIYLHRSGEGGSWGQVPTYLYLHNHASVPAGAPVFIDGPTAPAQGALSANVGAWVPLPLSWAAAIQAGTAKGIGISAGDSGSYSILYGTDADPASGRLSFDYA